jgi:hypothetical protein
MVVLGTVGVPFELIYDEKAYYFSFYWQEVTIRVDACRKHLKNFMILSKYFLARNDTISFMFRTQYTPDFLVAEP